MFKAENLNTNDHQVQETAKVHLPKWMRLFIYGAEGCFQNEEGCQIHIKCNIIFPVVPLALSPCLQRLQLLPWWQLPFPAGKGVKVLSPLLILSYIQTPPLLSWTLYQIYSPHSLGWNHFGCFQQLEVHFPPTILWPFHHYIFAKLMTNYQMTND